jgi:hypothetical protein
MKELFTSELIFSLERTSKSRLFSFLLHLKLCLGWTRTLQSLERYCLATTGFVFPISVRTSWHSWPQSYIKEENLRLALSFHFQDFFYGIFFLMLLSQVVNFLQGFIAVFKRILTATWFRQKFFSLIKSRSTTTSKLNCFEAYFKVAAW